MFSKDQVIEILEDYTTHMLRWYSLETKRGEKYVTEKDVKKCSDTWIQMMREEDED